MEKELESLGLTKNESKIYLFLLKNGETTTGSIIKETKIANSRVYETLNSLTIKGLVKYNIQKDGKHFSASNPQKLKEIETEKITKIEKLLPQLKDIQSTDKNNTITAIYEGYEGFKTAFKKIIDDCPNKGEIKIIGFSHQQYNSENLQTFLSNMNIRSCEKKQKLKIIADISSKEFQKETIKSNNAEIKYMPKGYVSPIAMDIFDEYVYIFMWEEKPFVFMIKNKKIADSFKVYFEFLWKMARSQ
ncbi:MAG TPA: helix-turn-helix domain-containing protein [Candidatus Nanoarchaeia archaeon]|nr:helix-turn-helix domain-containing protein [Candidatus Nanoarchaeia archaeon]